MEIYYEDCNNRKAIMWMEILRNGKTRGRSISETKWIFELSGSHYDFSEKYINTIKSIRQKPNTETFFLSLV